MKTYRTIAGYTTVFCAVAILPILFFGCSIPRIDKTYQKLDAELSERSKELKVGMSREHVEKIMKVAPCKFFFDEQQERVTWHWSGQCNSANPVKGRFDVSVIFDREGSAVEIYSGSN